MKLLSLRTKEQIDQLLLEYSMGRKDMRKMIISIVWHMRGGLSYMAAWTLCPEEREDFLSYIEERIKIVEKTKMPLL